MTRCSYKNQGISYPEIQRKHDIGQPTGCATTPSRSVESAGAEKHMAGFQHFILEWAKHLLGRKSRGGGSLGTSIQRELQDLPQRIVRGLTWTQEDGDKLGGGRQHGFRGHRPELEACPTTYFQDDCGKQDSKETSPSRPRFQTPAYLIKHQNGNISFFLLTE